MTLKWQWRGEPQGQEVLQVRMRIRLRNRCVLVMSRKSESRQYKDMSSHSLSINWRSGWKKNQFLTSLMTSSVRKVSFTIGLGVCQGTLNVNQTYPDVVRMWRQFHGCPVWRRDRTSLLFSWKTAWFSQEKYYGQDPGNHIEYINQYDVANLWWQRSLHRWWWHIQETQVVYSVKRLVGGSGSRIWLWYGLTQWS